MTGCPGVRLGVVSLGRVLEVGMDAGSGPIPRTQVSGLPEAACLIFSEPESTPAQRLNPSRAAPESKGRA